jgi:hypothetical protein
MCIRCVWCALGENPANRGREEEGRSGGEKEGLLLVVEVVEVMKTRREGAAKIERGEGKRMLVSTVSLELASRRRQSRRHGRGALCMYTQRAASR